MSDTVLAAAITGVLAIGSSAGLWQWIAKRGEDSVGTREVESAEMSAINSAYGGVLKVMQDQLDRHDGELKRLNNKVETQAAMIDRLRSTVRKASAWIDDLYARWDWHRTRVEPPARPNLDNTQED